MAVQKRKKSRSKRDKRRKANCLFKIPTLSTDVETEEIHKRHYITESGYYKGKQIFKKKKSKKISKNENI